MKGPGTITPESKSVRPARMLKIILGMGMLVEIKKANLFSVFMDEGASFVLDAYMPENKEVEESHVYIAYDNRKRFVGCSLPGVRVEPISSIMDACEEWFPYGDTDAVASGPVARKSFA